MTWSLFHALVVNTVVNAVTGISLIYSNRWRGAARGSDWKTGSNISWAALRRECPPVICDYVWLYYAHCARYRCVFYVYGPLGEAGRSLFPSIAVLLSLNKPLLLSELSCIFDFFILFDHHLTKLRSNACWCSLWVIKWDWKTDGVLRICLMKQVRFLILSK